MKRSNLSLAVLCACWWIGPSALTAAVYYTAVDGDDSHPGSAAQPWRTIQRAAGGVQPADTVIVRAGVYEERVTTARGGVDESNRITFEAEGPVTMRGWVINHPYITVRGFRVAQWSGPAFTDAQLRFGENGDFAVVEECEVRGDLQVVRTDMMFQAGDNTIASATGGFLEAGYAPGQTLSVWPATNGVTIHSANRGSHTITVVTDTAITVASDLVEEGPLPVYLTAAYAFGLNSHSRTEGITIRHNTFSNLGYIAWFVAGSGHRFSNNLVEQCNGWDIVRYTGTNHVFEGNWFRDSPLLVYQVSPDFSENWPTRYADIVFRNNFVEDVVAVISSQKFNTTVSGPITYVGNVFIGTGRFVGVFPNTTLENNTFLRVATQGVLGIISQARHPVAFNTANYATNAVIRNNVFLGCGEVRFPWTEETMGWYEIGGPTDSVVAEGNFVASDTPGYGAKIGWPETNPALNGGDPAFVNIHDPLGPDGIPFTADDGLRPLPTSKLVLAGAVGRTIGAYTLPGGGQPLLVAAVVGPGRTRLSWVETVEPWMLQSSSSLAGTWAEVPVTPESVGGRWHVTISTDEPSAFYRLLK